MERPGEDQPHPCGAPELLGSLGTLTHYPGVVVVRQHPLTQGHQKPEGLLLTAVQQEHRSHDVHGLPGREYSVSQCAWLTLLPTEQNGLPLQKGPAPSSKKQPLTNPGKSANKPICKKSVRQRQPASSVKVGQKALRKQRHQPTLPLSGLGQADVWVCSQGPAGGRGRRVYTTLADNKKKHRRGQVILK